MKSQKILQGLQKLLAMIDNILIHQILINDSNKLPEELPNYAQFCINEMVRAFPYAIPHLYSGEELESFIQDKFGNEVLKAYLNLKPYSYRSDLARFCLLYGCQKTRFILFALKQHIDSPFLSLYAYSRFDSLLNVIVFDCEQQYLHFQLKDEGRKINTFQYFIHVCNYIS